MPPETGNGDNVTWRELNLALDPLKKGLDRLESGVSAIATTLAEQRGRDTEREHAWSRRHADEETAIQRWQGRLMVPGAITAVLAIVLKVYGVL